jgi:C1A family cysteine protease
MPILRQYGWNPDLPKRYAPCYQVRRQVPRDQRPAVVDFRQGPTPMPGILNQGNLGSCTANSIAAQIKYLQAKEGLAKVFLPSRLAIYYWEREAEGTTASDAGASIDDQIKIVQTIGAPDEALWPYDISKFTVNPPATVVTAAALDKVPQAEFITDGLDGIMDSLENYQPVSLGFVVYDSFESQAVADSGMVPMPASTENVLGGHAVWLCGYDQNRQLGIAVNSWDIDWGDAGFFYLPFDYLQDPDLAGPFYSVKLVQEAAP